MLENNTKDNNRQKEQNANNQINFEKIKKIE